MKTTKIILKIALISLTILLISLFSLTVYALKISRNAKLNPEKVECFSLKLRFFSSDGLEIESSFMKNHEKCTEEEIPMHVKNAFIAIEDKRFYSHHGIDIKRIVGASLKNLKERNFSEGASTISQQLIKNTHLTSEKTLHRKLKEMKLALCLEKRYSKNEILTMYLNSIYFGENCYGIRAAAYRFFKKEPKDLSIEEGATLAAIIKAPNAYSPLRHPEKCKERRNLVLSQMQEQGFLNQSESDFAKNTELSIQEKGCSFAEDYLTEALSEIQNKLRFPLTAYGKEICIYTALDQTKQRILEDITFDKPQNSLFSQMITDNKNGKVVAFVSDCRIPKRQAGSTLKPFSVYAPALEYDIINESTYILDEQTDFGGYKPKNYGGKYYGYINTKNALAKSLNVPAIKILNAVGMEKSIKTLENFGFSIKNSDQTLALALGATEEGVSLQTISSAYAALSNDGLRTESSFLKMVTADKKMIFQPKTTQKAAISKETAFILCDMLQETVKTGTAQKLSHLPLSLCAKTGTVGNENGNSDVYSVSFTNDFTVACWIGANDNQLSNSITGGGLPTAISQTVWSEIIKNGYMESEKTRPIGIKQVKIDKVSYEKRQKEEISDDSNGKTVSFYYKKTQIPKTKHNPLSSLKAEFCGLKCSNSNICIVLCVTEYGKFKLFRQDLNTNEEIFLSSIENTTQFSFTDQTTLPGKSYRYKILPYYVTTDNKTIFGTETYSAPITTPFSFS